MNIGQPLRELEIELEEYEKALPVAPEKQAVPEPCVPEPVPA